MTQQLTIKDRLSGDSFKQALEKVLPTHLTPDRFVSVAINALTRTPKLKKCTTASFFECMMTCSQLGLEPDNRRAYLIPYGDKCTLIISYMGLIELCKRHGDISNVYAAEVHQNDFFEYDLGTERRIVHKPVLKDRGDVLGAYAVVTFKDGNYDFDYMSIEDIHAIRDKSQGYSYALKTEGSNPWIDYHGEMVKKTPIRRLLKRQTLSPEIRDQIEKEDSYESQSYQQRAANAKPADTNPFEVPETPAIEEKKEEPAIEVPAEKEKETAVLNVEEAEAAREIATEPEETQEESNRAEYEDSLKEEQREGGF